jgi:hypothetical protein
VLTQLTQLRHVGLEMLERQIERRLTQMAKLRGGVAIKWVAPAFAGVPDRIVFHGQGRITFVELKAPGKRQTQLQLRISQMLRDLGADVRVIDSKEGVDALFA